MLTILPSLICRASLPAIRIPGVPDDSVLGKKRHLRSRYQSALSYPAAKRARHEHAPAESQNKQPAAAAHQAGSDVVKQEEPEAARAPLASVANAPANNGCPLRVKDEPVDTTVPPSSASAIQAVTGAPRTPSVMTDVESPLDRFMKAINNSADLAIKNTSESSHIAVRGAFN